MKNTILSKQPYKGTMDWYPKDIYIRNYIFDIWSSVAKRYGYEEYDTAQLEDANLYKVKSGEELGGNQLYNFIDKGGREIALRPEMTPSLA
ncbi:MAG TPA: ATP phosphoribosyltransferase regulatory subunit, partial [Candidatus Dojkabacteria bacterium]|nr:ATP phosphoribosyltransferase regulatory subunit [Candidatus Dojkabacteria bacterium]